MSAVALTIRLPKWVEALTGGRERVWPTAEERMRLVIDLARANVRRGAGGPFGAAVFDLVSRRLLAPGVNLVVPLRCSCAHAEIVALALAQQRAGTHDLGADATAGYELVSSTEPCAMCMGAVPWSGVRRLVCGARGADAEAIGLDEGGKPRDWVRQLRRRGIEVVRDLCRAESVAVLREYALRGGPIYNGRAGSETTRPLR